MAFPTPGGDFQTWGTKLLGALRQTLTDDGRIKPSVIADIVDQVESEISPISQEELEQAAAAAVDADPTISALNDFKHQNDPGASAVSSARSGSMLGWVDGDPFVLPIPFWDIEWSGATAYPDGTSYASMADSADAINTAVATAKALGIPVVGRGTYRVDDTITGLVENADFSGATFVCNDDDLTVVRIGSNSERTYQRLIYAPHVVQAAKVSGDGWSGSSVGIEIVNCYGCEIHLGDITGFAVGNLLTTNGSNGCVYNTIHQTRLLNNQVNQKLAPRTSGWVNQNTFIGGQYAHISAEGSEAEETRHIVIGDPSVTYQNNSNVWINSSLESPLSPPVVEYAVESIGGNYNRWIHCRWESPGTMRVYWNEYDNTYFSRDNTIDGGYGASSIEHVFSANSRRNLVINSMAETRVGVGADGMISLANSSGVTAPIFAIYNDDPATVDTDEWRVRIGPNFYQSKGATNANPRFQIHHQLGRIDWGGGSAAFDTQLGRLAANVVGTGEDDGFRTGTFATANRPSASSYGAGTQIFDTTLNQPLWSNGSAWVDATGTEV